MKKQFFLILSLGLSFHPVLGAAHTITINKTRISAVQGDILDQPCQAIVNAAKETLLGGGGIDGAIHKAAGPQLKQYCAKLPESSPDIRCEIGQVRISPSFQIADRNAHITQVIHTVGPQGSNPNRVQLLTDAYTNSLQVAMDNNIRSIAFPAISAGIFGYKIDDSAPVAVLAIREFIEKHPDAFDEIRLVSLPNPNPARKDFHDIYIENLNASKKNLKLKIESQSKTTKPQNNSSFFQEYKKPLIFITTGFALYLIYKWWKQANQTTASAEKL